MSNEDRCVISDLLRQGKEQNDRIDELEAQLAAFAAALEVARVALREAQHAIRHPIDGWQQDVQGRALQNIAAALSTIASPSVFPAIPPGYWLAPMETDLEMFAVLACWVGEDSIKMYRALRNAHLSRNPGHGPKPGEGEKE